MNRSGRRSAAVALNAYIAAFKPTTSLAQHLAGAIGQMLANDQRGTVTINLPGNILIVRKPDPMDGCN
jgi:hypothetical protein